MTTLSGFSASADISDPRVKQVRREMEKYKFQSHALVQILHGVQDVFGYVPMPLMVYIAENLRLPPSRVYGVVTFYHYFSLKPRGTHNCLVCLGTACYVRGGGRVLEALENKFKIRSGETTADGGLGLQTARCLGSCGLAPAMVLDDEIIPRMDPEKAVSLVEGKVSS